MATATKKAATKKTATKKAPAKKAMVKKAPAKKSAMPKKAVQKTEHYESALKDFFIDELKDIYWAEKHLVKVLPKMQKAATSDELADAIASHLEETRTHVERLEQVFELIGETARAKKCEAMEGLAKEGTSIIEDTEDGSATRDVGIILACQKVEHYEIATYGGLAQLARTLGMNEASAILEETLAEEKTADETLTDIAENNINQEAASEDSEDE